MPKTSERYLIEQASFRDGLEPELVRLFSEIWSRKTDVLRPCWIVIPAAPLARHLKRVLLNAGVPLLNVEFLTLTGLRDRLAMERLLSSCLGREKQELLLRVLLEERREAASALLTAVDAMHDAGHSAVDAFKHEGNSFKNVVEDFENQVGERSIQYLDRELLKRTGSVPVCGRDVALYGFDAGDWSGAWVLLAGARMSERSAVFIRNAGGQVESLELSWMTWWREHYGGTLLPTAKESYFSNRVDALVRLEERMFVPMREAKAGINAEEPLKDNEGAIILLRHKSAALEARDSAALAATWSAEFSEKKQSNRVGLIFSGANSLSRLAVAHLLEWRIPFEDQLGSPQNQPPENTVLKLWLQMQQEGPHAGLLEKLARELKELAMDAPLRRELGDHLETLVEEIENGKTRTMSDHIEVIARSLGEETLLAKFSADWRRMNWPETMTACEAKKRMSESLVYLFGDRAYELEAALGECAAGLDDLVDARPLARREWVRYFESVLGEGERIRYGRSFSPVVVTSLEKARGQCFDGTIFCGLNEGCFPAPLREMPFHLDKRACDFDAHVSKVDEEDVRRFGLWHGPVSNFTTVRGLERQRFWDAIGNAGRRVCFSCFVWDDLDAHAQKEPSELYDWAWWARYGFQQSATREIETKKVEEQTARWSRAVEKSMPGRELLPEVKNMAEGIRGRFDPQKPFGPDQFIVASDLFWKKKFGGRPLRVTMAEDILEDPASVWFEKILGVSPRQTRGTAIGELPLRRGTLLHEAVRQAMSAGWRVSTEGPIKLGHVDGNATELRRGAIEAWVNRLRTDVETWFGRLPVWWVLELAEMRSVAWRSVAHFAEAETRETKYAVEMNLGTQSDPFRWREILWAGKLDHIGLDQGRWKVTDLKTSGGSRAKALKPAAMHRTGEGSQLVLYALMLAEKTGVDVSHFTLCYYYPRLRGGDESVDSSLESLVAEAGPPIAYLREAWGKGWFGQRSDLKKARPLAYLPIPDEVLREKWNRTEGLKQWAWEVFQKKKEEDEENNES